MKSDSILFPVLISLFLPAAVWGQSISLDSEDLMRLREPPPPVTQELDLVEQTVEAGIRNRLAQIEVISTFENRTNRMVEGIYLFPLPPRASVSNFRMEMGGKILEGEILEAEKARAIYESILRKLKDPGLLDMLHQDLIRTRIFPVNPGTRASIHVTYSYLLQGKPAVFRAPFFARSRSPVGRASVNINIEEQESLKSIYSPSHPGISVERPDPRHATVHLEQRNAQEWNGFALYYDTSEGEFGSSFLSYRDSGKGFWTLLISPGLRTGEDKTLSRDLVFVLDRSGSMQGRKIEQAREALSSCISRLSGRDRFNVISFATGIDDLGEGLLAAGEENRGRALESVSNIRAEGGTNIEGALEAAFRKIPRSEGRVPCIFFITDGLPTVGVTDIETITRNARTWNNAGARLFCFGIGNDVNTYLLDSLARDHRGARDYASESEGAGEKVTALFGKLSAPLMANVQVTIEGVSASEMIPKTPGDLYLGDQIILAGRYSGHGKGTVTIEGRVEEEIRRVQLEVEFPERDTKQKTVACLWARRRIGHLLDEIRLNGAKDRELVDEIISLSRRYRIVTPFTAFLITGEGDLAAHRERLVQELAGVHTRAARSGFQRRLTPAACLESMEIQEACK